MALTDKQVRMLRAKLCCRHVKTRLSNGRNISYIEGWHAVAEANRIFGYDAWDRQTQSPQCVWSELRRGETACLYWAKVRISVRAGDTMVAREGIGTGFGRSPSPETAHEIAMKAAETDATKRALATFGNPFGLALYDKDQTQVSKKPRAADHHIDAPPPITRLVLRRNNGREESYNDVRAFAAAMVAAVSTLSTINEVYAFWEANLASICSLGGHRLDDQTDAATRIVSTLKQRAREVGLPWRAAEPSPIPAAVATGEPQAQSLAIPKEKRLRDKDHLAFVASQPCLVCGRNPAQAHHLRFAQPRAMAMKVSDEFTVPLCNIHHDALHRAGDERAWWARHGILDPLQFARRLWTAPNKALANHDEASAFDAEGFKGALSVEAKPNGSAPT